MKIILPRYQIIGMDNPAEILKRIELFGRVCYKSENKISEDSSERFIRNSIKSGHESVIEHEKITIKLLAMKLLDIE